MKKNILIFSFVLLLAINFKTLGYDKILVGEGVFYDSTALVYNFSQSGTNWWDKIGKKNIYQVQVGDTLCSIDKENHLSMWQVNEKTSKILELPKSISGMVTELYESKLRCNLIKRVWIGNNLKIPHGNLVFRFNNGFQKNINTSKENIFSSLEILLLSNSQKPTEHINFQTQEGYDYNVCSDNYYSVVKSIFKLGNRTFALINEYSDKECPEYSTYWIIEIIGTEYRKIWHYGAC